MRPLTHKWARSPAKVPPEGTGPFGDLKAAKMTFKGESKHDPRFYTIEWKDPVYLDRGLNGTLFTKVKITSSLMTFDVRSTGSPVTALFTCKGSARIDGEPVTFEMQGYYTFYSVREPLVFKAPIK